MFFKYFKSIFLYCRGIEVGDWGKLYGYRRIQGIHIAMPTSR